MTRAAENELSDQHMDFFDGVYFVVVTVRRCLLVAGCLLLRGLAAVVIVR